MSTASAKVQSDVDFSKIKDSAAGRWPELLPAPTALSAMVLTNGRKAHPCPRCNGDTVRCPASDARAPLISSAALAHQLSLQVGHGIATVEIRGTARRIDVSEAVSAYLGMGYQCDLPQQNVSEQACPDKRMSHGTTQSYRAHC